MVRKLLALVLCWLVLLPQSLCTCAAAFAPCCPPPASAPTGTKDHRCASHRHSAAENPASGDAAAKAPLGHTEHRDAPHEPTCAAVTGGQSATAPQAGVVDAPPADVATLADPLLAGGYLILVPPLPCLSPPHVPLYLSLNVLRN